MAFEDIFFWLEIGKWLMLGIIAWWWYNWVREKLAFSPLLTIVIGGIVVYFLAFEHPFIGGAGILFWVTLTSGLLFMLPTFGLLWNTAVPNKPKIPFGGTPYD